MNSIYQNAALTIISAAGIDENNGLPGVGSNPRARQLAVQSQGTTVLQVPRDPQTSIASSTWSTRGWTFQEALLSRRRLVFTDAQVYFECNTMNCFEGVHCPLDMLHIKNKSKTREYFRSGMFGRNREQKFGKLVHGKKFLSFNFCRYLSNVEYYSSRNLRYDEDSLNAFKGVLGRFAKEHHSFNHIWGIAYTENSADRMGLFVYALAWAHDIEKGRPRRRYNFPSWAWTGWQGRVKYAFSDGSLIRFCNSIRAIHFGNLGSGSVLSLADLSPDSRYEVLHITAPVIPFEWFKLRRIGYSKVPSWTLGRHKLSLSWSRDLQSDAEIHGRLKDNSKWQCVYTGSHLNTSFVMVLELQPDGSTWQRAEIFWVKAWSRHVEDMFRGNPCLRMFAIV